MGVDAADVVRWFLAGFFLFVAGFYTAKILIVGRRLGRSPVAWDAPGSRHFRVYWLFRVFRAIILVVCLVRVAWPPFDQFLIPIRPLWTPWVLSLGSALLLAGFAAILAIHVYMSGAWRSGIDRSPGPRPLITTGPYALTRNPIAVLIQVGQLGLFLALPSVFTLVCLVIGVYAVQVHVRLEEAELLERHGARYAEYQAAVPRWLGRRSCPYSGWLRA